MLSLRLSTLVVVGVVLLGWYGNVNVVEGMCCFIPFQCTNHTTKVKTGMCFDCTESKAFCGAGKCNAMGCDCDKGCRMTGPPNNWCWSCPDFPHHLDDKELVQSLVARFDANNDNGLDRVEFENYLRQHRIASIDDLEGEFQLMDKNNDQLIELHEIDPTFKL